MEPQESIHHIRDRQRGDYRRQAYKKRQKIWILLLGIWLVASLVFLWLFFYPKFTVDGEQITISEYAPEFFEEVQVSLTLILPALLTTVLLAVAIILLELFCSFISDKFKTYTNSYSLLSHSIDKGGKATTAVISALPIVLSSIPIFITAIFAIRYFKLNTMDSHNFLYGVLCLGAFNVSYFYRRCQANIEEAYRAPDVLYARSLGLSEGIIFRHYVLPRIFHNSLMVVRELLPHITVESIVIEYTFSYNALMRSAVQSVSEGEWLYFMLFIYFMILFISAFDMLCRWLESFFTAES